MRRISLATLEHNIIQLKEISTERLASLENETEAHSCDIYFQVHLATNAMINIRTTKRARMLLTIIANLGLTRAVISCAA